MAEERLIDDDKDRKYKIRKNEDGEEELVLDDTPEEEEQPEEIEFEVPELSEDDEEAAVMTPEQLAARDRERAGAEERRLAALAERIAFAKDLIAQEKYDDCVYVLDEAIELERTSGEAYALKIIALTKNFTDVAARADEALTAAEYFYNFATDEVKEAYSVLKEEAERLRAPLEEEVSSLRERNDEAKGARREAFLKKRNFGAIALACTGIPLVAFAVLAIYFSTVLHAVKDGTNMVLFFVFLGLAVVMLAATAFAAHKFWDSAKLLALNEKNSSSKLGREFDEKNTRLKFLEKIFAAYEEKKDAEGE